MDIVISAATHRAGSTLVQRIFNARPETLIWGEHDGILTAFLRTQRRLVEFAERAERERHNYFASGESPNVWTASMTPPLPLIEQAFNRSLKSYLDTLYVDETHDVVGFKEVRYGQPEIDLLLSLYPSLRIILLTRHPVTTWQSVPSGWFHSLDHFVHTWNTHTEEYLAYAQNRSNCTLIRYEDLVSVEPDTVKTICKLAQISEQTLSGVLSHKLNSTSRPISASDEKALRNGCAAMMSALNYQ
jgi:hypothetical protein